MGENNVNLSWNANLKLICSLIYSGTTINDLTKFRTHVKGLFSKKGSVFKHSCNSGNVGHT